MKRKRKKYFPLVLRGFISLISVYVLVSLIYPLLANKSSFPCANTLSCRESLSFKVENGAIGIFNNRQVASPKITIEKNKPVVLGTETSAEKKRIYVDLAKQTLTAYEGDKLFMQTLISSGKWFPTPTGEFRIWVKLRSTRMSGGEGDDYYDLPNVPFVMFYENQNLSRSAGFSLHGAYWHNNFGHPMSHGCINLRNTDAEKLYDWANPVTTGPTTYADNRNEGTTVTIFGEAPL